MSLLPCSLSLSSFLGSGTEFFLLLDFKVSDRGLQMQSLCYLISETTIGVERVTWVIRIDFPAITGDMRSQVESYFEIAKCTVWGRHVFTKYHRSKP